MEKKRVLTKRIACLLCSIFVLFVALMSMPMQANAVIGGYTYPPQYFPVARFDFCYAVNSAGSRYFLDWPLNEFAVPGYNFESQYEFTNDWFRLGVKTVMESDSNNTLFPYVAHSMIGTNVNWADGTGRSFNLFAYEMPWLEQWQGDAEYIVSFGNGGYMFDCDISFDLVYVTSEEIGGDTYYQTKTVPDIHATYHSELNETIIDANERYNIDLSWCLTEMYVSAIPDNYTQLYQTMPFLKNVNIKFYNVTADPELAASTPAIFYVSAHTYRLSESNEVPMPHAWNMQNWLDSLMLKHQDITVEDSTIVYDMPTNWVSWLGTTVGNVLNVKLFGNFSLGGMLATVIGILIFVFFIKVFKG